MTAYLEITTVSHCKNVCCYCPQSALLKKYGKKEFMTLENFRIILSKLPKDVIIDFAGYAESFLNKEAAQMMLEAYQAGYRTRLFTTLVGLTDQDVDKIKQAIFDMIVLHLPDNEGYMKADVTTEYIRLAKRFKEEVGYNSAHCYGTLHKELVSILPGCVSTSIETSGLHTRGNNLKTEKVKLTDHPYTSGPIQCGVIWREKGDRLNHNVVLPNGQVQVCCMDYTLEMPIGNLLTDSYESLFSSDGYKRIVKGMTDESIGLACRNCKETYPGEPFKY